MASIWSRPQWVKGICPWFGLFSINKDMGFHSKHNPLHYCDAMMGTVASQITSLTVVYLTDYSDADQRKHQISASLAFVPGNSPGTGEFPAQMASNAENVFIWWRHHAMNWDRWRMPYYIFIRLGLTLNKQFLSVTADCVNWYLFQFLTTTFLPRIFFIIIHACEFHWIWQQHIPK